MRDRIITEIFEIEGMLDDDRLDEHDFFALYGAQQALRNVLLPDEWQTASKTFYRLDARPADPESKTRH